jgi:hypothetical protein
LDIKKNKTKFVSSLTFKNIIMKKMLVLAFLAAMFTGTIYAIPVNKNSDVLGEWKFESPHAPYGYNKGSIVILEKEGALAGEIKFADGTKVEMKNVSYEEGVLKFNISVEYNNIPIKATFEGKKMKGSANTPDGDLPFEATKLDVTE